MSKRPYWLTDAKVEHGVYLTKGQWPIAAFSAESQQQAAFWAGEKPGERVVIGPVPIPDDVPTFVGKVIPAERVLIEADQ